MNKITRAIINIYQHNERYQQTAITQKETFEKFIVYTINLGVLTQLQLIMFTFRLHVVQTIVLS